MALHSRTSADPSDESTARHEPPAELQGAESTDVADPANGSDGDEGTAADLADGSVRREGARTHRKGLSPAFLAFLGVIGAALISAIAGIIIAEINRHSPDPPSPSPTHSVTPGPSPTLSPNPSPSPSPSFSPSPSPSQSPTVATPTSSLAPPIDPNAHYMIENAGTGSCLSYTWPYSPADPSPCIDHADTDGWLYYAPEPGGTFELQNKVNKVCLGEVNVDGGVPAATSCNGAPGQQWRRGYAHAQDVSFVNIESGLCLAATGPGDSGSIQLESCDKQPNQLWHNDGTI